jgi:uncharacterized membrane protein SirB2
MVALPHNQHVGKALFEVTDMLRTTLILVGGIALIVSGSALATYLGLVLTTAVEPNWTMIVPPVVGTILLAGGAILVLAGPYWPRAARGNADSSATTNAPAEPFHG